MIVAIHQPNFLPWLGYFYKMARCDRFVLLDSVSFAKGSYTNRVQIKTPQGPQWLTVPVQTKGKLGAPICEILTDENVDWRGKICKTLETNYKACPHYQPYGDQIREIIASSGEGLSELNIRLIEYLARQFEITVPTCRSTALHATGKAAELLAAICRELGATTYLSGSGGANYQDEQTFQTAGLELTYANYSHPRYRQAFGDFAAGLSAVDLLLNCGPGSAAILRGQVP
jgi:hypothetical protein